jgi:hypothetical protein
LLPANIAFGTGIYQRTRNARTLVWNNYPKPGDEATWSGYRDSDGYAHGFGTLTWYTVQQGEPESAGPVLYARYWGHMVRGKFNGPVNVHSRGKTNYAIFVDGVRKTRWAAGPAPYRAETQWHAIARRLKIRSEQSEISSEPAGQAVGETPAEGPSSAEEPQGPTSQSARTESSQRLVFNLPKRTAGVTSLPPAPTEGKPRIGIDDSLRLLVWPPRSLRMALSPRARLHLAKKEVLGLADALARSRGYNLAEYETSEPYYDPAYQTWSLTYDQRPVGGKPGTAKCFSVAVSDKTKAIALVEAR